MYKMMEKYNLMNASGASFYYQLLDRLRSDCDYFLGNGNRLDKYLWAGDRYDHIKLMMELYNYLSVKFERPEWISWNDIYKYSLKICGSELDAGHTVKLIGCGTQQGKPVKELQPGDVILWNYGYSSVVLEMKPTKSGKMIDVLLKSDESEDTGTRRMGADRLVAIGR